MTWRSDLTLNAIKVKMMITIIMTMMMMMMMMMMITVRRGFNNDNERFNMYFSIAFLGKDVTVLKSIKVTVL